ncbi:hypothetical protein Tco_0967598 [Tanacetum coccineum]
MAESSSQKTSSLEITPKEEPVTLDNTASPNPFLPARHVDFTFDEITFTTNNEVALLYPSHPNQDYFEAVSDFISKCCLKEALTRAPNQYKEYLRGVKGEIGYKGEIRAKGTLKKSYLPSRWRLLMAQIMQCLGGKTSGLDQISNKDVTILYCLATGVQVDYAKIIWEDLIHKLNKKSREKICPYPGFLSLLLEHMMPEYENEELTINPTQMFLWTPKLQNLPHQLRRFPKAKSGLKRKRSSKHTSESTTKASKSQTGQSKKETKSSSDKDKILSQPSPPTPVVGEMHKEAQKAAGGPTSLGATSKEGAHPQLSSGMFAFIIIELVYSASFIFTLSLHHDMMLQKIPQLKLILEYLLLRIPYLKNRVWMKEPKTTHLITYLQGANEESRADDISLKIKREYLSDILKDTRFAFFTPNSPPDEPIIVLDESEEEEEVAKDKDTKATSHDVPQDTSVPPPPSPKLAQIQELMAQELLAEFLNLPSQVSSVQEKLKTLDSLPSLLHKVTDTLNRFPTMMENASDATSMNVPSAGKTTASPAEGEKNTKDAEANMQKQLIDLLGIEVVEQYHNKKLIFDKYYDKMLKRKKSPKITNCEILTKKGPITLKIYREDGSDEVISNLKTRLDQLTQTEQELKIDLNKPIKEQDPLNELNELANKKRKRTSDLKDHSTSTKKHKLSSSA